MRSRGRHGRRHVTVRSATATTKPQHGRRGDHQQRRGVDRADGADDEGAERRVAPAGPCRGADRQADDPAEAGPRQQHRRRPRDVREEVRRQLVEQAGGDRRLGREPEAAGLPRRRRCRRRASACRSTGGGRPSREAPAAWATTYHGPARPEVGDHLVGDPAGELPGVERPGRVARSAGAGRGRGTAWCRPASVPATRAGRARRPAASMTDSPTAPRRRRGAAQLVVTHRGQEPVTLEHAEQQSRPRACGGGAMRTRPPSPRPGWRRTSRSSRRTSRRSTSAAASRARSRAWSMSNHIDCAYISQWYGANGVSPRPALARIAATAGRAGSERTWAPVPAWAQRCSSASRIVPKRSVPALKIAGPLRPAALQAHRGQVVGVDELVAVGAVAEHERVGAVGDPVEQDAEDAEAAVAEDRARPHDRDVEPVGGRPQAGPLGGELGVPVGLLRAWAPCRGSTGSTRGCRTPRSTTCARPCRRRPRRHASSSVVVPSTLTVRSSVRGPWPAAPGRRCGTRRRRRRRPRRTAPASRMSAVRRTLDAVGLPAPAASMSSTPDVVARGRRGRSHEQLPEVAVAAGDAALASQRRVPSLEAPADAAAHALLEADRRLVAELGAGHRDVAGDRLVHLAEHVELLDVAAGALDQRVGALGERGRRSPAARTSVGVPRRSPRRRGPGRRSRRSR